MSDQPAPFAPPVNDDYWVLARQPLQCLLFLSPLLAVYELGVLQLAPTSRAELRNGADYWLRETLRTAGLVQPWLLPAVVVGLLFGWHVVGRYRWSLSAATMIGMFAESLLFGACLMVLGQLQDFAFRQQLPFGLTLALQAPAEVQLQKAVGYVGAGIYEELLFRLLLLPVCYLVLRCLAVSSKPAVAVSVLATSLLFAGAHYVGPAADVWSVYSFTFRTVAGVFFALLFVLRGFGITVGAHAAYDLLIGILLPALAANAAA